MAARSVGQDPAALAELRQQRGTAAQSFLRDQLAARGLAPRHDAQLLRTQVDAKGASTSRFQQLYQGVKVWDGQWLVHQDAAGRILPGKLAFQVLPATLPAPVLTAKDALAVAQAAMKAKGAYAGTPGTELVLLPNVRKLFSSNSTGIVNARDVRNLVTGHTLAYHVSLALANREDGVAQRDFMIHAQTGQILRDWNSLESDSPAGPAVGTGKAEYSGTVNLNTTAVGDGTFNLVDSTRGTLPNPTTGVVGNATYDFGENYPDGLDPYAPGTLYNDADDQWGDGANFDPANATDSANGQTAGVDAHFGLQATWDTYKNVFSRDGIDDLGTSTFSRVHYAYQYANAFWSGACFCMTYGDGTKGGGFGGGSPMNVFTELDVAGHEMSHGVMGWSANLYYYDEMGGLNESNSDIMGKMVEFYALGADTQGTTIPDTGGKWQIGWALMPSGTPLRWMTKPSLDGQSPDYWTPSLGDIDVHYSSGPNNRFFYFLSVGASADPGADTYSRFLPGGMTGIHNQDAAQIWYRALTKYMTPTTRYFDARKACVRAATDLFGELSPQYRAVQNAYAGINVGVAADGQPEDLTPPVVNSVSVTGTGGTVYLAAAASDDHAVASVDYFVDGFYVGTGTGAGFKVPLDSSTISNGAHTLTAVANDTNQNAGDLSEGTSFSVHNSVFQGLQNGGFEWALESWTTVPGMPDQPYLTGYSHSGSMALLWGANWSNALQKYLAFQSAIYQDIVLPSDCDTLTLDYWFFAAPPDPQTPPPTDFTAHDTMTVQFLDGDGGQLMDLGSYSNLDDTPDPYNPVFVHRSYDVSGLKGQTVRLRLDGANDDQGYGTVFILDDFGLNGTSIPVAPAASPDLNGDGVVDGFDLALLMVDYSSTKAPSNPRCDLNGDGIVDDKDLQLLLAAFGK